MKNIIVPVDFSDVSKNAVQYAIEFAKILKADITFLHVYHIPAIASESVVAMPNFENLEKNNLKIMEDFEKEIKQKYGDTIHFKTLVKAGFLIEEMKELNLSNKFDFVVMGITGAGKLGELLMGSNATIAIHSLNIPIVVVPADAKFTSIKNIAFACDFDNKTDSKAIEKVKSISQLFNAQLHILNVIDKDEMPNFDKAAAVVKLEIIMNNVRHTLNFPESDDVTYAINEFIERHDIDLLIMIPHKHNFLQSLFHKSNTKSMAFHTHVPLLTINE